MKCEDCLPIIEDYVDGELDGRTAAARPDAPGDVRLLPGFTWPS